LGDPSNLLSSVACGCSFSNPPLRGQKTNKSEIQFAKENDGPLHVGRNLKHSACTLLWFNFTHNALVFLQPFRVALANDLGAKLDAFVANKDLRPGNYLQNLMLLFSAE
jgi:hypothetical protein